MNHFPCTFPYRMVTLSTVIVCIFAVSGCNTGMGFGSWFGDQNGATEETFARSGTQFIEPAVRREVTPPAIQRIEPAAGGIYLSDKLDDTEWPGRPIGTPTAALSNQQIASNSAGGDPANVGATELPVVPAAVAPSATPLQTFTPAATLTPTEVPPTEVPPTAIPPTQAAPHRLSTTTNILVLGSDRRQGTSDWRTDIIMLIALDFQQSVAGVISFPRDIYVDSIPGHSPNKLNVVDYLGERRGPGEGPKLLGELLSRNLGIPIDHYVRFEFESFKDVVDALGGLDITVDCPIFDEIEAEDLYINLAAGSHTLNGEQALSYVRTRRAGGDLERVRRQQRVVWALRQQFLEENWLPRIPALYGALSDTIDTDLGLIDIARLAQLAMNIQEEHVHGVVIAPPDLLTQNFRSGMFVFDADWDAISRVTETVFNRPPFMSTNTVGPSGDQPYCP